MSAANAPGEGKIDINVYWGLAFAPSPVEHSSGLVGKEFSMRLIALLGLAAILCPHLLADTVLLADGTEHEGKVVKETPQEVTFQIRMGGLRGSVVIPKAEIISLKFGELPPDTVAEDGAKLRKLAEAETDPAKAAHAWLKLGEYYDRHPGYSAHARSSYEKVLLFDANHGLARARLGFVKGENGEWRKPEPFRKEEPAVAEAPAAPVPQAPAAKEANELAIGLRKDAATVKKILEDEANRIAAERERLAHERQFARHDGWNGQYFLLNDGLYYYPPGSVVYYTSGGLYGFGGYGGYCGNGYYGGSYRSHSDCGYGYGTGLSLGFRGSFGNVKFRGSFNGGGFSGRGFRF